MSFSTKKNPKEKPPQPTTLSHSAITITPSKANETNASNSNGHLGFKPVTNLIDVLFPYSPCEDPIDLLPELAPLGPLQDLNDISAILDSNLSVVDVNATDKQQVNEIKKQNSLAFSIRPRQTTTVVNKISHVGFSVQSGEENAFKFYCLIEKCSFWCSSYAIGVESHFMCEHSKLQWNGYCLMCKSQCFSNNGDISEEYSISEEIRHMMEKHATKLALDLNKCSSQHSTTLRNSKIERPKIRLRRLKGDCLSRTASENILPGNDQRINTTINKSLPLPMLGPSLFTVPNTTTKEMPPQPQIPLTEPLFVETLFFQNLPQFSFNSAGSDLLITCEPSGPKPNQTPLKISNVMMNNKAIPPPSAPKSKQMQIPIISSVRTAGPKAHNLGTQQMEKQRLELLRATEDSHKGLVAKTIPFVQSKAGNFLVTKTVQAQHEAFFSTAEGFNISTAVSTAAGYKTNLEHSALRSASVTSGTGCKFFSRVPVTMSSYFPNKQYYLVCRFCFYCATNVEDYTKHANQFHIINKSKEVLLKKLRETINEIVGPTGLADDKLYRCVIKSCQTQLTETTFLSHLIFHITATGNKPNNYIYKCPHCTVQHYCADNINAHIKNHAKNHYFCYLCAESFTNSSQILKHFSENHLHIFNLYIKELLPAIFSTDGSGSLIDSTYYIVNTQEIGDEEVMKFGEKLILEWQFKKSRFKTCFKATASVNCGEYDYKTMMHNNMYRQSVMGKQNLGFANNVCGVVPGLNNSEQLFDKTINLGSSSVIPSSSGSSTQKSLFKLPQALMEKTMRYTCGCQYNYAVSPDLFPTHMSNVHSTAMTYCTFCKGQICKRGITIDRIMNHTRFHGTTIYRCEECNYVHHMRRVVEIHVSEKHSTMMVNIVAHNRSSEDSVQPLLQVSNISITS